MKAEDKKKRVEKLSPKKANIMQIHLFQMGAPCGEAPYKTSNKKLGG